MALTIRQAGKYGTGILYYLCYFIWRHQGKLYSQSINHLGLGAEHIRWRSRRELCGVVYLRDDLRPLCVRMGKAVPKKSEKRRIDPICRTSSWIGLFSGHMPLIHCCVQISCTVATYRCVHIDVRRPTNAHPCSRLALLLRYRKPVYVLP